MIAEHIHQIVGLVSSISQKDTSTENPFQYFNILLNQNKY